MNKFYSTLRMGGHTHLHCLLYQILLSSIKTRSNPISTLEGMVVKGKYDDWKPIQNI
ncbi:hypothetical protein DFA_05459 [Cavenderia fasciculata]|uniref:Uncharacterized protein n=1 Tax=Cavenderia fasciculata TaxID=261658 RepID=F4PLA5_CACFS|nr:uncharacterized protein DFA_05459 [Cavenderia fasciculata]EGG23327.1 hypothetical protein DFA_05459 [Cavenderia fasciculata]|eukprot:XP_004361178.1 hypothetical protein DFA_05459 [Cavenderia fasciculata]